MSVKVNLNAYFERIGFTGSIAPTLALLEDLCRLHPAAIPFENLDPLLGTTVLLDQVSLEQKLLHSRRGGFCFEHNTLLMRMLIDLGYTVRGFKARGLWWDPTRTDGPPGHMLLGVDIGGVTYLADVGFGSFTLTAPLRLKADVEQQTPNETFRLIKTETGFQLEVKLADAWKPLYRFDPVEQSEEEFQSLSNTIAGEYRDRLLLVASRAEAGTRFNLMRNRLTIHRIGQDRERRELESVEAIKAVLSDTFRIQLPPADRLDPVLSQVLEAAQTAQSTP